AAGTYGIVSDARHASGTSPTNGRRSVATTTSAADTHRDPGRSNFVEEAHYYSNKHSGAVQPDRRRSSAPAPGDQNTLLYPMQVRYDEHFDSEDAIRMVMRPHSKAEDKKNDKSEPHAPQGRRDVGTQRLGSAL
ncbi:hypothetical protein CF336_g8336, partial [Tilletia laevis]